MTKIKSRPVPASRWVYFVFNWGSPAGVFSAAYLALAFVRLVSRNWGEPLPEGVIQVVRYRPAVDISKFIEEDITETIIKHIHD